MKAAQPDVPIILLTAFSSIETAVEAMKQGAYHYANKPFNLDEIALVVQKALETTRAAAGGAGAARVALRALRAVAHRRRLGGDGDAECAAAADRRQPGVDGAADRRERDGQGSRRQDHPLQLRSRGAAVHEHHLLGAARGAARERAVRARARRVHRRAPAEDRAARVGRRRHGVPRRDRRDGAGAAGEAAAVPRGEGVQAGRRRGRHARRRPGHRRDQPRSRGRGQAGQLPRGSCTTG